MPRIRTPSPAVFASAIQIKLHSRSRRHDLIALSPLLRDLFEVALLPACDISLIPCWVDKRIGLTGQHLRYLGFHIEMARAAPETHHMGSDFSVANEFAYASNTSPRRVVDHALRVDRHAPGKNYIELLAVLVDRSRPRRITLCMTGCEMCGECPLPELYIIFVLDDSVDFDGL